MSERTNRIGASLIGAMLGGLAAVLVALVDVYLLSAGFGAGDLPALVFWTIPFVALLTLIRPLLSWTSSIFPLMAVLGGLLIGLGWTWIVALLLGPWFLTFSFPIAVCWMTGGVVALLTSEALQEKRTWILVPLFAVGPLLVASAWLYVSEDFLNWYYGEQSVEALMVRRRPQAAGAFRNEEAVAQRLTADQREWQPGSAGYRKGSQCRGADLRHSGESCLGDQAKLKSAFPFEPEPPPVRMPL